MATIVKCFVLVGTDDAEEADRSISELLGEEVFDRSSKVLDFKVGVEQKLKVNFDDYVDGEFLHYIPEAPFMIETAQFTRPS